MHSNLPPAQSPLPRLYSAGGGETGSRTPPPTSTLLATWAHLAEQAVHLVTHGTRELVDIILEEAPAPAVGGLAVVAGVAAALGDGDAQVQKVQILCLAQELQVRGKARSEEPSGWGSSVTSPAQPSSLQYRPYLRQPFPYDAADVTRPPSPSAGPGWQHNLHALLGARPEPQQHCRSPEHVAPACPSPSSRPSPWRFSPSGASRSATPFARGVNLELAGGLQPTTRARQGTLLRMATVTSLSTAAVDSWTRPRLKPPGTRSWSACSSPAKASSCWGGGGSRARCSRRSGWRGSASGPVHSTGSPSFPTSVPPPSAVPPTCTVSLSGQGPLLLCKVP